MSDASTDIGTTYMSTIADTTYMEVLPEGEQQSSTLGTIVSYIAAPFMPSQDPNTDPIMGTKINTNTIVVPDTSDAEEKICALFQGSSEFSEDPLMGTQIDGNTKVQPNTAEMEASILAAVSSLYTADEDVTEPIMCTKNDEGAIIVPQTAEMEEQIIAAIVAVASLIATPFIPDGDLDIDPMTGTKLSKPEPVYMLA